MSSYIESRRIAQLHMDRWTVDSADVGSINTMIMFARVVIIGEQTFIRNLTSIGDGVSPYVRESEGIIEFWNNYIAWGSPIIEHWWKQQPGRVESRQ